MLMLEDASFHYSIVGQFEDCWKAVTKGLEMAAETGIHYLDHWFWSAAACAALSQGDIKNADQYLGHMQAQMHTIRDWQKALYHALSFTQGHIAGRLERSRKKSKILPYRFAIKAGVQTNPI